MRLQVAEPWGEPAVSGDVVVSHLTNDGTAALYHHHHQYKAAGTSERKNNSKSKRRGDIPLVSHQVQTLAVNQAAHHRPVVLAVVNLQAAAVPVTAQVLAIQTITESWTKRRRQGRRKRSKLKLYLHIIHLIAIFNLHITHLSVLL